MSTAQSVPPDEQTQRTRLVTATIEKRLKKRLALIIAVSTAFTAVTGVAAVGYRGRGAIDKKADASELQAVRERVTAVETSRDDDRRIIERIESKVDWLIAHYPTSAASPRRGK